ncbi:MAG: Chaperone protein DnaJ [Syntrophomonadaceae bacterium]|nr:Chaperone protein DnaJ [Bacillota bacterium]MBT9147951.1 Chaperone protein DnaJ [Bacillota bacterium]
MERNRDWYSDLMNRTFEEIMDHMLKDCRRIVGSPDAWGVPMQPGQMDASYHMLGLEKSATDEEVKKRYRDLARRLHPDTAGKETEHLFKLIQAAYEQIKGERGWL